MARKRTDHRGERQVEAAGDAFMGKVLGFEIYRFSQARATQQTPGIPDRLYCAPKLGLAVWWEAKTEIGAQRVAQAAFQRIVESCGYEYVVGRDDVLHEWAIRQGLVERIGPAGLKVLRRAA